jgi:membrane fusion protein (multidrug efflux system)
VQTQPIFSAVPMTGTVTSPRNARLSPATSGQVYQLHVDAGSVVTRGTVLLELDPELTELQLRADEALLAQSRSAFQDAQRRLREARELIPQASIAESTVRDLEAEVVLDEAALEQANAATAFRRAVLERHRVTAPFDGVVSAKLTELGEWVTPGTPVLGLVATEGLRLDFTVADDFISDILPGATINYWLSTRSADRYEATVDTIVPVSDTNARTFLLRAMPGSNHSQLRPGMSVTATLRVPAGRDGVVVPRDALLRSTDGRTVIWTVSSEGEGFIARERRVQTGLQTDGMIEVVSGVGAGNRIVVRGNEALREGQSVEIRVRSDAATATDSPDV